MNFIHTFDSKPLLKNKFAYMAKFEDNLRAVLTDYTYSAYCIKAIPHQRIILYTDSEGAKLLDHIPYDEVHVLKDFQSNPHFAASIKFEAIKNMTSNDCLIDGDLFIQNPICVDLVSSYVKYDFVYSFFEPNSFIVPDKRSVKFYDGLLVEMAKRAHLFTPPYNLIEDKNDICWPNTSLMKFNNMKLKNEYLEQYMKFKNGLNGLNFKNVWPDVIIEQYHMKCLLEHGKYSAKAMIENFPTEASNTYALSIGFTHLGGGKYHFTDYFNDRIVSSFGKDVYSAMMHKFEQYKTLYNK